MRCYTGVGSRTVPEEIGRLMRDYAYKLAQKGYILRSGGANGADTYFEQGCDAAAGKKEIYLPWKGFNNHISNFYIIPPQAYNIAAKLHPAWNYLKTSAKSLHARNIQQCAGKNLDCLSEILICWTRNGQVVGGTATAIRFALDNGILVYNLFFEKQKKDLNDYLMNNINTSAQG